jgi:DNA (cytosine-5)-methyltransferase 1
MRSFPSAIDVFAGAGGLSLGARIAGFRVAHAIERDAKTIRTYMANHRGVPLAAIDLGSAPVDGIATALGLGRGQVDLVMGGPPCQGFSIANLRTRNASNPANHAFKHLLTFAELLRPQAVLLENVGGILTFDNGQIVRQIVDRLARAGYETEVLLLDAADFGVPQRRKRVFIVGLMGRRPETSRLLVRPTRQVSVSEALDDLPRVECGNLRDELPYPERKMKLSTFQRAMRGVRKTTVTGCAVSQHTKLTTRRFLCVPQGGNWEDIPSRLFSTYRSPANCHRWLFRRLDPRLPAITISNFRKGMIIHPNSNRTLSIREAARLQAFPDWYVFTGNLQSRQQQVANAVPPRLAALVLRALARQLA